RLMKVLTAQFDSELTRSVNEIEKAISPYTRFIRAERQHLEETQRDLSEVKDKLETLKASIG
ncbi:MAG: dynamin, partial [Anaerolineae bacterium]